MARAMKVLGAGLLAVVVVLGFLRVTVAPEVTDMQRRPVHVDFDWEVDRSSEVHGITERLRAHRFPCTARSCIADEDVPGLAREIIRTGVLQGADPWRLAGMITVENPWLDSAKVSYAGAVGLMQVIPRFWEGRFPECGDDLRTVRTNLCYGARIAILQARHGPRAGLLAYNGCTRRECAWYADSVLARSGPLVADD